MTEASFDCWVGAGRRRDEPVDQLDRHSLDASAGEESFEERFASSIRRIPYGDRAEKVQWPGGAHLACSIYVALEWFVGLLDPRTNTRLDLGAESERNQYGFDVGLWRALELLDDLGVTATFLISGTAVLHRPEAVSEIHRQGHEIASHGLDQSRKGWPAPVAQSEVEVIRRTTELLRSCMDGNQPRGWVSPGGICTPDTPGILADLEYRWLGDLRGDDLPYVLRLESRDLVIVPHRSMTTNDFSIFGNQAGSHSLVKSLRSPAEADDYFRSTFDSYLQTAKDKGSLYFEFGIHPFVSCLPDRIQSLYSIVQMLVRSEDVEIMTMGAVADYWHRTYV